MWLHHTLNNLIGFLLKIICQAGEGTQRVVFSMCMAVTGVASKALGVEAGWLARIAESASSWVERETETGRQTERQRRKRPCLSDTVHQTQTN